MSVVEAVEIIIPSNPKDREDIKAVIKDLSDLKTKIEAHNDAIKDGLKGLEERYNIKAKWFRQMLNDFHKDEFDKKVAEKDAYGDLYEAIVG